MYRNYYYAKNCLLALSFALITLAATITRAEPLDLNQYRGQVVYVDFWASWCGPCRASFPFMNAMHKKYADDGLTIIAVNVDAEQQDAQKFLDKLPANFAIHYDPSGASATKLGVTGMPHSFLYDQSGLLLAQHQGFRKDDPVQIEASVRQALGLEPGS